MPWILCSTIECSGFHEAWLNAVDFMQHGPKHPDWIQWIPWSLNECEDSKHCGAMDPDCMQWSPCSEAQGIPIECSGFYEAWPKASRLNAVDSMHCDWMRCNLCSVVKCIPIECSGFHAAWLNVVDSMQREEMEPYWMQWILCSTIECSGFHEAWLNAMDLCSMAQSIPIECSGFHALWLNAVNCMQRGKMHPDWMQWIPCSVIKCSRFHTA